MFLQKRLKQRKRKHHVQKRSIDQTHTQIVEECRENKNKKLQYEKQKMQLEKQLKQLQSMDEVDWTKISIIEEDIENLSAKISECATFENDYYIENAHLLFEYYDIKSNHTELNTISTLPLQSDVSKNSVLSFFLPKEKSTKNTEDECADTTTRMSDIVQTYQRHTTPDQRVLSKSHKYIEECQTCKCHKVLINNDSTFLCPKCGEESEVLLNQDKPSYKEPPKEYTHFAYKRINHFNEWLSQFQAKESTFISPDIIDKIKIEMKKERLTEKNIKEISVGKIRLYLKKLGLNKYYEHIPHIMTRITNTPPPVIPRDVEEKLRTMFKQIQTPFFNHVPKGRKNFLSYSYVLHKFTELLNMDELSASFPLLKSRSKLYQQDLIWKDICKDLNWQFIRSI